MKISDAQSLSKVVKLTEKEASETDPKASPPVKGVDRVTLSPQAREIRDAQRALAAIPEVREDKVAEVKARIAEGRYRIDSQEIAERMIKEALSDKD